MVKCLITIRQSKSGDSNVVMDGGKKTDDDDDNNNGGDDCDAEDTYDDITFKK